MEIGKQRCKEAGKPEPEVSSFPPWLMPFLLFPVIVSRLF